MSVKKQLMKDPEEGCLVRTRNTRTGDPRKVDEWKVKLPDGSQAKFDLCMEYDAKGDPLFTLKSDANHFRSCKLAHSEPASLRAMLHEWVAEVIRREIQGGWAPAVLAETRVERRETNPGELRFSLMINYSRVDHLPDEPIGNRGETVVRGRLGQSTVVQRALSDDFSDCSMDRIKGNLLSQEFREFQNSPFRNEHGDPVSRVVTEDFDGMIETLEVVEAFSLLLADRMSHQAIRDRGPLMPSELVELMQDAVNGTSGPQPAPLGENEFRI